MWLDHANHCLESPEREHDDAIDCLLYAFLFLNLLQLISLAGLSHLDKCRRGRDRHPYCPEDLIVTSPDSASISSTQRDSPPQRERTPLSTHSIGLASDRNLAA
jgi:hypothetical protein